MIELEERQTQLLQKLDVLYDRIKTISTLCNLDVRTDVTEKTELIAAPEEIVVVFDPKILPSFLGLFVKNCPRLYITWHIHSSVSTEDSLKIKDFFKNKPDLSFNNFNAKPGESMKRTNLRLIFKNVSASAELRMSSLEVPLVGIVNILRFLCLLNPTVIQYDQNDYFVDNFLDQCHLLEKTSGKQMEEVITQMFSQCKNWIYKNELSIVDVAAFIIIKLKGVTKAVPKTWYNKCEKGLM